MKSIGTITLFFLTTTAGAQHVTVSHDRMNVAYMGISNPISVTSADHPCDKLVVTVTNGTITGSGCDYSYIPGTTGDAIIIVSARTANGIKTIDSLWTRVKRLPTPIANLAGKHEGSISLAELQQCDGPLPMMGQENNFAPKFVIASFSLQLSKGGVHGDIIYSAQLNDRNGAKFDVAAKDAIKRLKKNDKIIIEDIKVIGPDSQTRLLSPITLTISG